MSRRGLIVEELRNSTRLVLERGSDVAVLWVEPGDAILADVHDVSLGGLGVFLRDVADFPVGRQIDLVHLGRHMRARIRHIDPQPDGEFLVGLECERPH